MDTATINAAAMDTTAMNITAMDTATATLLNQTTQAFYATCARSFSDTRQSAWAGWKRVVKHTAWEACPQGSVHTVLDVACGNMRFKKFLECEFPSASWNYYAVDNCEALLDEQEFTNPDVHFMSRDILLALQNNLPLNFFEEFTTAPQLSVCFGFFHHVPKKQARAQLLQELCAHTAPGGIVAISLWRFMDNPALAQRARTSHAHALDFFHARNKTLNLEENDYVLGWQNEHEVFRYAHHFTHAEAEELVQSVRDSARLTDSFVSDGRSNNLNEYLVFQTFSNKGAQHL